MKGIDVLKFSSRALWIFLFVAILLVASVPVLGDISKKEKANT